MSHNAGAGAGAKMALVLVVALVAACTTIDLGNDGTRVAGSGTIVTRTRPIDDVKELVFASQGTVLVSQSEEPDLGIEADDNLQDYIEVESEGATLRIRTNPSVNIEPSQSIVFRVGAPSLHTATMTGVGEATMDGWHTTDHIAITISGTIDMNVTDLRATSLDVDLSGVGNLRVSGSVDNQTIVVSGTGSYLAGDLASESTDVTLTGVGAATVWATEELRTELSGTGSVSYYGSPAVTGEPPSGVGSLTPLGNK